jgi:prepilin-type processing-associated H-X9-DG protein
MTELSTRHNRAFNVIQLDGHASTLVMPVPKCNSEPFRWTRTGVRNL